MKYTKQELLRSIITWIYSYEILDNFNENFVDLKSLQNGKIYSNYEISYINEEVKSKSVKIKGVKFNINYEIY